MEWKNFSTGKICPVCGLVLDFEPWTEGADSQEICPCCGVQFGYYDSANSPGEVIKRWFDLRKKWIQGEMRWWSPSLREQPSNWNPNEQLKNVPKEFLSEGEKY